MDQEVQRANPPHTSKDQVTTQKTESLWNLLLAVKIGNRDVVRDILKHPEPRFRIPIEARDYEVMTSLVLAARAGHTAVTQGLLEQNADVEAQKYAGSTALAAAARNGHYDFTSLLFEYGANLNAEDCYGNTPLDWPS
ncbi:putative Ankyrin repeat protein [Seiridium cardinale]